MEESGSAVTSASSCSAVSGGASPFCRASACGGDSQQRAQCGNVRKYLPNANSAKRMRIVPESLADNDMEIGKPRMRCGR